jgi:hypothetical protein
MKTLEQYQERIRPGSRLLATNTIRSTTPHAQTSFRGRGLERVWVQGARAAPRPQPVFEQRDELARILEEPPGGENFGYRGNGNGTRESLNYHDWVRNERLAAGGWSIATNLHSGLPRGRPKTIRQEWCTPEAMHAVEQRLGFARDEFRRVVRKGRLAAEDRELRETIANKLEVCVRAGAAVSPLADVLGCSPQTIWRLVRK